MAQCLTGEDNPVMMNPRSKTMLDEGRYEFAIDALKKTAEIQTSDNIFFSPDSIHSALTLAYFGARGNTEASLKKALHIPDDLSKIDVMRYYAFEKSIKQKKEVGMIRFKVSHVKRDRNALGDNDFYSTTFQDNGSANYEYKSANRLWVTNARKLRDCMLDLFNDQLVKVDFKSNPLAVRKTINDWVSNTTKGHIRDLLPEDSITEDTDLVLANAVYFKGLWQSRFDPANSKRDIFYTPGSQNSVITFMRQKKTFNHG